MTAATPNQASGQAPSHDLVRLEGFKARAETYLNELVITVAPEDYRKLCEQIKNAGFDFPRCLSGTDMGYGLRTTLHLQRGQDQARVTIRSDVPYDKPHLPSVCDLWGGVEWHERESYDLVGIHYDNHPDQFQGHPRRLLLEDDWTIHPLQKRYDTRGYLMPDWQAQAWPSPAPHEDGFVAFAPAAPAAHAKPTPAAAPKAVAAPATTGAAAGVAAPAATPAEKKEPKRFVPAGGAPAVPASETASVAAPTPGVPETAPTPAAAGAAPPAEGAAPKIKRWEPKGAASTQAAAPTGEAQGLAQGLGSAAPSVPAVSESPAAEPVVTPGVADVPATPVAPSAPEALVTAPVATPPAAPTASVPESVATASVPESAPASSAAPAQDDLTIIEGIGPKRAEALYGAGLKTFVQLSAASTETLSSIMQGADLSLEPGIETWATQAEFLVRGDTAGFKDFTDRLVAGKLGKEKSPKIKRWEPKKEG